MKSKTSASPNSNAWLTAMAFVLIGYFAGPGHLQAQATTAPTSSPALAATPDPKNAQATTPAGFWGQDTLTGDWGGLRKKLEDDGFAVNPTYTSIIQGNPSGGKSQGFANDGLFNVQLDFDLEKMTDGDVTGLTVHANALYIYGPSLSQEYVGDFSGTNLIYAYNTVRLQELWLEKWFLDKRLSLKVGNMAVDTEYFQSSSDALFINSTFTLATLMANNVPNSPTYPVASPGVRLKFLPTPETYVMTGVYGMDNSSNQATTNKYGTRFALTASSGMFIMSEAGYLLNQQPNDKGLQGTYRLGSWVHTADYDTWGSQADNALGTGPLKSGGSNYGVYGLVDQQVYSHDAQSISLFAWGGGAPSNINFVDWYFQGGVDFTGFIPGRDNDVAGVAFARSDVSGNYSASQVLQGNPPSTAESVLEATYKVQVAPWWSVQPDLQYYFNPSGVQGSSNAVVLGISTNISF